MGDTEAEKKKESDNRSYMSSMEQLIDDTIQEFNEEILPTGEDLLETGNMQELQRFMQERLEVERLMYLQVGHLDTVHNIFC